MGPITEEDRLVTKVSLKQKLSRDWEIGTCPFLSYGLGRLSKGNALKPFSIPTLLQLEFILTEVCGKAVRER